MPYTNTGETHYHAQLQDKGRAIKELVVYYMLLGCCFLRSSVINKSRPLQRR